MVGAAVDERANLLRVDAAPGRDALHELTIEIVRQRLELLAIFGRHGFAGEPLSSALVAPDAHHFRLHVEPIEDTAQEQRLEAQPHQEDVAGLRQPELAGGAGDQQALGLERFGVGHDGDVRLAQAEHGAAQREYPAQAVHRPGDVQQHPVDLGIFGGGLQCLENVEKVLPRAAGERQTGQGKLLQGAGQTHHQPEAVPSRQGRPVDGPTRNPDQIAPGPPRNFDRRVRHQDLRFRRPFR